jgi:hypothetical protein
MPSYSWVSGRRASSVCSSWRLKWGIKFSNDVTLRQCKFAHKSLLRNEAVSGRESPRWGVHRRQTLLAKVMQPAAHFADGRQCLLRAQRSPRRETGSLAPLTHGLLFTQLGQARRRRYNFRLYIDMECRSSASFRGGPGLIPRPGDKLS